MRRPDVKTSSGGADRVTGRRTLSSTRSPTGDRQPRRRALRMADVACAALIIGMFLLLALMVRGLEKLK